MVKLSGLKPRLNGLRSRIGRDTPATRVERDRVRDAQPWRRWYKTARWQALRMAILTRDMFTCQWLGCGRVEPDTSKLVADHREPHRGDERLFWDQDNLWCLCKHCHDSAKQRQEHRAR